MMLLVHEVIPAEAGATIIGFDNEDNKYEFYARGDYAEIVKAGHVVKVRSVKEITKEGEIILLPYSSVSVIPGFFLDVKKFGVETKPQSEILSQSVRYNVEKFKILQDFDVTYSNFASFARSHPNDFSSRVASGVSKRFKGLQYKPMKELLALQEKTQWDHLDAFYRTKGYILDMNPHKLTDIVKRYCMECQTLFDCESNVTQHCSMATKSIYCFVILLKDHSIHQDERVFEAFVCSTDENPNYFFPNIVLDKGKLNEGDIERFEKVLSKIYEQVNFVYDFVLQPIVKDEALVFRVIDTILFVT
eukprot:TRINITY_DN3611_c0_g1_i5.p1 TRINITY_DN3611_c0_g1~~TRINITY_DN3611_c0_g1_i5.p1  ORF type:complete len:304 (+),score=83.67 TRINITY_DN3611_c0_g1_i5:463-1374(+)